MDKNYWKEAYKEYWEISSKKEIFVKELIESKTGFKTLEVGLGAGSEDSKSIPANVVAVGVPCRVMREITEADKYRYPLYQGS